MRTTLSGSSIQPTMRLALTEHLSDDFGEPLSMVAVPGLTSGGLPGLTGPLQRTLLPTRMQPAQRTGTR